MSERVSHYDYDIQAWIDDTGHVMTCGHVEPHRNQNIARKVCTSCQYAGLDADVARAMLKHDRRQEATP